ncbi:MAG: DUF6259 domain-containing protein [Chloroflexota bacterium]
MPRGAAAPDPAPVHLRAGADRLAFDRASGALVSWVRAGTRRDLIAARAGDALVELGYVDPEGALRTISDAGAPREVRVTRDGTAWTVAVAIPVLAGHAVGVTLRVAGSANEPEIRWTVTFASDAGLRLTDIRFPVLRLPLGLGARSGTRRTDGILRAFETGAFMERPRATDLEPDSPFALQLRPETIDAFHYPGLTFAQLLAYLDRGTGLVAWAADASGRPKVIKPLATGGDRVRLAFAHTLGGVAPGPDAVPYDVRARSVAGGWEDAAAIYRDWTLAQPWAARPLHVRGVPDAIAASPAPVMIRVQGVHDEGPADPIDAFLPYPRLLPILDALAARLDAPLLPLLMAWERHGPWVYPDALPPVGGSDAMAAFADAATARGWVPGTVANGTRWVPAHRWTGYDGREAYRRDGGPGSVCRTPDGGEWLEPWDAPWRASLPACVAAPRTRALARDFVGELARTGLRMIQLFDQNLGVVTFPCYADDHGHPPAPGPGMTRSMASFLPEVRAGAREGAGDDGVLISAEACVSEPFLGSIDLVDVRSVPPGHVAPHPLWRGSVPLYSFLFHDQVPIHAGFGFGPEPFHLRTATATAFVVGAIPGGVLQDDGRLMSRDSVNFGDWDPYVEDWEAAADLLRAALALRRGTGRPWLLEGRMERSARLTGIPVRRWTFGDRVHRLPAVLHHAWRAPDGTLALVLANWTDAPVTVRTRDPRFRDATEAVIAMGAGVRSAHTEPGTLALPPRSVSLLC